MDSVDDYDAYYDLVSKLSLNLDIYMVTTSELISGDSRLLEVDHILLLPIGTYIRVNVTSSDVLHC
jgi:heme/copper-type cytochrome/quinol oxidase subunit 2